MVSTFQIQVILCEKTSEYLSHPCTFKLFFLRRLSMISTVFFQFILLKKTSDDFYAMKHARKRSYFQIPAGFPFFSLRWFSFHLSHFASHHLSGTCCDYDRHQWRSIPVCCNGNAKACQSICVVLDAWHSMRLLHTLPLMPMYMQLWESARNVLTLWLDNTLPWTTDCRGDHPKLFCFLENLLSKFYPPLPAFLGQIEGFLPESAMDDLWTKSGDTAPLVGANSYGAFGRKSVTAFAGLNQKNVMEAMEINRSFHRFWKLKKYLEYLGMIQSSSCKLQVYLLQFPFVPRLHLERVLILGMQWELGLSGLGSCNGSWLRQESRVCHGMECAGSENHQWNLDWRKPSHLGSFIRRFRLEFMIQRERVEGIVAVQLLNSECMQHVGSASKSLPSFAAMPRISTVGIIGAADPYHLWAWRFHRFFLWLQDLFLPGGSL